MRWRHTGLLVPRSLNKTAPYIRSSRPVACESRVCSASCQSLSRDQRSRRAIAPPPCVPAAPIDYPIAKLVALLLWLFVATEYMHSVSLFHHFPLLPFCESLCVDNLIYGYGFCCSSVILVSVTFAISIHCRSVQSSAVLTDSVLTSRIMCSVRCARKPMRFAL